MKNQQRKEPFFHIQNGVLINYIINEADVIIPNIVTEIGNEAFKGCTEIESVKIPSGVTKIGERAFSGCSNLTNVEIPSTVSVIDRWAFETCTSLKEINLKF